MEKEEILQRNNKKRPIGEMELSKINKGNWIAVIIAATVAIIFMVVEGLQKHYSSIYALATVCYVWASVFYFLQYFIAKRPKGVLIGAFLHGLAAIIMLIFYVIRCV